MGNDKGALILLWLMVLIAIAALFVAVTFPRGIPHNFEIWWWPSSEGWTALFTAALTGSTVALWIQTKRLAKGAEDQGKDVRDQLAVVRDDFTSTHRPWIAFDVALDPKGVWHDAAGLHFKLNFTCTNKGTTPAVGVTVNADAYLYSPLRDEIEMLVETCDRMTGGAHPLSGGSTIFPGGIWKPPKEFIIAKSTIDKAVADKSNIIPIAMGCADYAFSFGQPEVHQTRFIFYVGKKGANGRLGPIVPADGDLPAAEILLVPHKLMAAFAVT